MTFEQQIVMDLLGQTLFGEPFSPEQYKNTKINWEAVYNEARRQTVIPTVIEAIPNEADRDLRLCWINDAYIIERNGFEVLQAHNYVAEILKKAAIPFVLFKGASSGSYYPKPYYRCYGDVDLLVDSRDIEKVKDILIEHGFSMGKELSFEFSMSKDGIGYDIHSEVSGIPEDKCGEYIYREMENIFESSASCMVADESIPVPDDYHHGLIQLLHTAKHLVGFGAGLRQLCDWAVFVNHIGNDFPSVFEDKLKKSGLWTLANVMSYACVKYMHMPSYSWISPVDSDLIERFMEDLLRKGSLAHNGDDDMDSVFVTSSNNGGVSKNNMFFQMLRNITDKVCWQWPVIKKHRILIPFGIIMMGFRYIIAVIKGDYKKINLKETVDKANKRKALYGDLGLFTEASNETDR